MPPKFTVDFLNTVLDLKSSSFRAMIPLLKRLGFLDAANTPTQAYKDFRESSLSGVVMAERLRDAYSLLFKANEYAWKLTKPELMSKLRSLTGGRGRRRKHPICCIYIFGVGKVGKVGRWLTKTEVGRDRITRRDQWSRNRTGEWWRGVERGRRLGYTINLNLPATTEIEVFNAIFKSLRENLLRR